MNITLLWLMSIPIIGAAAVWYFNQDTTAKFWLAPISFIPGALLIVIVFIISFNTAATDTEILNGKVISKDRKHDSYQQPYECMCTTDSKGNRSCSTCYETRYTVQWLCNTTVGDIEIEKLDRGSSSVYKEPDPSSYTAITIGEPAARQHSYTNYVQAVPNSLFATPADVIRKRFIGKLPEYPENIYHHYRINRFVSPGFSFVDVAQWNQDISMMLRELGPQKQVNVIVVVPKTNDREYTYALREHWEGANKNDVVLVIGSLDGRKIEFVDVISWTKSEIFKVQLIDRINEIGIIERTQIMAALQNQISKNFERRRMREFEYLKGEIDPPEWLLWTLVSVLVAGYSAGALMLTHIARTRFHRRW